MIVSFSGIRQFKKCQRQWSFKEFKDFRGNNDSFRRELHLLSKLQSVYAWRGNLVDYVITVRVIPTLKKGWTLNKQQVIGFARQLFVRQLNFARANRLRESGMTGTKAGEDFAALSVIDFGEGITDEIIEAAWQDVETALTSLLEMTDLLDLLKSASQLIPQRSLTFEHFGTTFRAMPDLIAFFEDAPPLIIDWKVHSRATTDYRLQLAAYALSLKRCPPHKDFPEALKDYRAADFRLLEVQLLTKVEREHFLTAEDLIEIDNFLTGEIMEIKLAVDGTPNRELDPYEFPITLNPDNCEGCNFRKPCREEIKCQQQAQMSLQF